MLRLISSRPLHLLLRRASPLHQLRSLATEILPIPHEIEEVSPAHHELLEVLSHRSSQLSSSKKVPEKVEERKAKKIDDPSFPPPNRLAELSAQLHLNFDPEHELLEEAEEEPSSTLIPDEPVLAPSLEDLTWTEDDKTLNDLLSSLHSTKVRRIHKYTDEQLSLMHKHHEFNRMLQSYVDVSIHNGQLGKVRRLLDELLVDQERRQSMKHLTWRYVSNVNIYNSFFFAYAERGNLPALQKLFEKMRHHQIKPNLDSFAAALSCLGHMDLFDPKVARRIILDIEKEGYRVVDLFNLECLNDNHVHRICKVLRTFRPDFDIPMRSTEVKNPLLTKIYQTKIKDRSELYEEKDPWWKKIDQTKILDDQLAMEMEQKVIVKSIEKVSQVDPKLKERYEDLQNSVTQQLTVGFLTELEVLKKSAKNDLNLNIIPFLEIFETKDYVDFMSKELNRHFYASDFYSTPYHTLCVTLGKRLYQKYLCTVRQKSGFIEKLRTIYDDYLKYALTNERFLRTEREKWNEIVQEKSAYMDRSDRPWTYTQVLQIGEFLYNVMLKHLKLRVPLLTKQREKRGTKSNADAILYTVYRTSTHFSEKQIKVHPNVSHFFSHIPQVDLEFDSTELPCLTPPLPWLSPAVGGYLLNQTDFVRLPVSANEQETRLRSSPVEKIGGLLDSINILNSCAWKINEDVLDLLIEVFQKGGSRQLSVPVSVANAQIDEPLPLEKGLTMDERKRRENALALARKLKAEVYSLWCNELYRLSIANHFRKRIFWFPHNMDFRGRVYPVPPHFNHLGSDVARSIILFADGKPLGPHGLRRLKIHLVNLTDLKKKASIDERARYADEILDEILDSADRPLTGRRWWAKSEEPWQTLACCMEIARAIRSGDPENYISHFPVHQDGSCNVLQHYAAMGLDDVGAASVNLKPSALPQDVYSVVVDQVEHERRQDAEKGLKIAQILQGFVKRKVIKQTIMTTNYGVTMYGARQQISRQLRDLDDFPKEYVPEASNYLAQKTFLSLRELFRETRKIQDWFTDCAGLISRIRGTVVEWNTPMNLPVIQPYYREVRTRQQGKNIYDNFSSFGRPNNIKQRNAFPPNYVHSLDSTHMMMTALQCARHGLTFVSVHDSFWTHACDVDQLNRFTREQFVALHNQPLLEILSRDFLAKYEFKASELARAKDHERQTMKLLNETLRRVPQRGSFRLESVLDSTYFFS